MKGTHESITVPAGMFPCMKGDVSDCSVRKPVRPVRTLLPSTDPCSAEPNALMWCLLIASRNVS